MSGQLNFGRVHIYLSRTEINHIGGEKQEEINVCNTHTNKTQQWQRHQSSKHIDIMTLSVCLIPKEAN